MSVGGADERPVMKWHTAAAVLGILTVGTLLSLFTPLALPVLVIVLGIALVVAGIRSTGWIRFALVASGTLLALAPVLVFLDFAFLEAHVGGS